MALLRRTLDAAFLNAVCNDPEVRPWLGGEGPIELTATLGNLANIALVGEHGGFVVVRQEAGIGEAHTQILPSGRGEWAVGAIREAMRYVFTRTEIDTITTKVPAEHKGALLLVRQMGFQEVFRRPAAWPMPDAEPCDLIFFHLTFDRWRERDDTLLDEGRQFHAELEAAKSEWGCVLPDHPEDESHDRAAGASVLMMRAGNPGRAVVSYNRWAALAGYDPINLLSLVPMVVDIGAGVIVTNTDGQMEVLSMPRLKGG